ncbi:FmdB family zinc ribbon protein [Emcibacter sp.]|uniref:FmdB family zinc ribbon protein n=1 Tax=Emcibacter sp. TaxID=1979954 RepID=UPI003A936C82
MPTYTYETIPQNEDEQAERFEVFQKMSDAPLATHPETGVAVRKVIASSFAMKRKIVNGGVNISRASAGAGACGCATGKAPGLEHNPFRRAQRGSGVNSNTHSFGHKKHNHQH